MTYKFDSVAYQKEVMAYDTANKNRFKQFNAVFGDTAKNVTKKNGVLKEAARILSNPGAFLEGIGKRYAEARKKYPK